MGIVSVIAVRELAGVSGVYEKGLKLFGIADGTNKTFYVPNRFIIDANASETVTTADVTVYDDGVSVAITSIDVDLGQIVLTAAPGVGSVMTGNYMRSTIKESRVVAVILRMTTEVEREARTKGTAANAYTQYWDGNGAKKVFNFRRWPVTSITAYDIDGTTTSLIEGTDYWLYPEPSRALWIEFASAPSNSKQNVQLSFEYGEVSDIMERLVKYMSAREIVLYDIGRGAQSPSTMYSGIKNENVFVAEQRHLTMIRRLDEEIQKLWFRLGGQLRFD